jgi:hypothetical protein
MATAFAFLVVIPEGDLLLLLSFAFHLSPKTQFYFRKFPRKNTCQAPNTPKPAPIKGISIAHQFHPIR